MNNVARTGAKSETADDAKETAELKKKKNMQVLQK